MRLDLFVKLKHESSMNSMSKRSFSWSFFFQKYLSFPYFLFFMVSSMIFQMR